MVAVNYSTVRENLKTYCDKASLEGETVIVTRKGEKNIVILSVEQFNELQKLAENAKYLAMIDKSMNQIADGGVVMKGIEEFDDEAQR